ncbi:MCE family protein [Mycobacterium sp. URHB0044]|jgi:phospholipid/cholesterol/gamma-HCH transport system substrate-binding protein|uniref:MCE family protein n=1 Tax=Mycobacterium sp. URHB0044 TaxID=1380386 RepID=UPI0004904772|nr:MCE family protein [Mycobacterium sp. URHB0044]
MKTRNARIGLAVVLALALVGGLVVAAQSLNKMDRTHLVAYFDNSNGLFPGDEVRVLGVAVGAIDTIDPEPNRVKISFWVDDTLKVPAEVRAAILSPQLVTARAIQLTPVYTGGPVLGSGAVIPQTRTAVPLEWDDLRAQLDKLTVAMQPTQPGGVSTLGAFIDTAADNLRGQGTNIRDAIIKMSQAFSIVGDHSNDIFSTIKNLSVVVSALHDSSALLRQLNTNLASVTGLLANQPDEVGQAISDLNAVVGDTTSFIADNREALGTTTDRLSSISQAVNDSLGDIKQTLHVAPTAFQNFINIYQPAQAALSGDFAINNFANPISFLCGAIQAASRLGAEQSAKLCVQYLAPIIKNRQYNFPPIGENLIVGASARPNEVTYSEDWMRPDYVQPQDNAPAQPSPPPVNAGPLAAESTVVATDPAQGLTGMMAPPGGGS